MRSRSLTEEEWEKIFKRYEKVREEKSQAAFCREEAISDSTFYKHYIKYKRKEKDFVRVKLPSSQQGLYPKRFWVKLFGLKVVRLELDV